MPKIKLTLTDETGLEWLVYPEDTERYVELDKLNLEDYEYCVMQNDAVSGEYLSGSSDNKRLKEVWDDYCVDVDLTTGDISAYDVLVEKEKKLIHAIRSFNLLRRLSLAVPAP